jgi:hypothetical protein
MRRPLKGDWKVEIDVALDRACRQVGAEPRWKKLAIVNPPRGRRLGDKVADGPAEAPAASDEFGGRP